MARILIEVKEQTKNTIVLRAKKYKKTIKALVLDALSIKEDV